MSLFIFSAFPPTFSFSFSSLFLSTFCFLTYSFDFFGIFWPYHIVIFIVLFIYLISLLSKFLKLLINVYSQIKGEDCFKDLIKLKVPIAQTLQESKVVQKKDHKALLQESFIYHMENLKFVSLIVVVPKEKDVNFQSLNDSTKRDLFLLPFRDEILDEMVIHKKQGNVENVVCQEESHVDEAKIDIIQNMTILTSLEALKVFVQKVRSLERFIHMLTCLLLSRVMYHIDLLLFGKLMKIY